MNNTIVIDNSEKLSRFVIEVDHLHDALLHEVVLLHPGYVDQERNMWNDAAYPDGSLVFQSQSPDLAAVQLNLTGVTYFRFSPELELCLEAEFSEHELIFYLSGKAYEGRSEIRAAHAEYRILGQAFLGSEYKLSRLDPDSRQRS